MHGTPYFDRILDLDLTYELLDSRDGVPGVGLRDPRRSPSGLAQLGRAPHLVHGTNSSLEGNTRRAIDFREGEKINAAAFKQLIRAAVAANSAVRAQKAAKKK